MYKSHSEKAWSKITTTDNKMFTAYCKSLGERNNEDDSSYTELSATDYACLRAELVLGTCSQRYH